MNKAFIKDLFPEIRTVGVQFSDSKKIYRYGCYFPTVEVGMSVVVDGMKENSFSCGKVVSIMPNLTKEVSKWVIALVDMEKHNSVLEELIRIQAITMNLYDKALYGPGSSELIRILNTFGGGSKKNWQEVRNLHTRIETLKEKIKA